MLKRGRAARCGPWFRRDELADDFEDPPAPSSNEAGSAAVSYGGEEDEGDPRVRRAEAELLGLAGVEGVGLGQTDAGAEAIIVYVSAADAASRLPASVAGLPLVLRNTGPIQAY